MRRNKKYDPWDTYTPTLFQEIYDEVKMSKGIKVKKFIVSTQADPTMVRDMFIGDEIEKEVQNMFDTPVDVQVHGVLTSGFDLVFVVSEDN